MHRKHTVRIPNHVWIWLLLVLAGSLTLGAGGVLLAWGRLNAPLNIDSPVLLEIPAGSSLSYISKSLAEPGWLEDPLLFSLWARLSGDAGRVKAGEFELDSSLTPLTLLAKLVRGDVKQYAVTLVEGWTFRQAWEVIRSSEGVTATLQDQPLTALAKELGFAFEHAEGLLFPDTYFYTRGTSDRDLLIRAHERLLMMLELAWQRRSGALPFSSAYEALILASIVEKETAVPAERAQIAGVFVRRLEQNMRLQSDPTVIYGMGERYQGNISRADLNEVTPYNTYRVSGLPPTPIALSGQESIEASVNPDASDALYFVARGDGSHQFSRTLEEHNAAVRQYQLSGPAQ